MAYYSFFQQTLNTIEKYSTDTMKKLIIILTCMLLGPFAFAEEPDWSLYQQLLSTYVTNKPYQGGTIAWVNYSEMKKDPLFARVVKSVETFQIDKLKTKEEEISFYINAYNIMAMKVILEKWPVKSIKDVGSFFIPVWHKKAGIINQKKVSLHHLEHNVIRKFNEPRVHFGVNCGSIGCPDILKQPYVASTLYRQLDKQAAAFLNDPYRGIKKENNELHISKIFKWFKEDFESSGGPAKFISQYYPISKGQLVVADLAYDWKVNGE